MERHPAVAGGGAQDGPVVVEGALHGPEGHGAAGAALREHQDGAQGPARGSGTATSVPRRCRRSPGAGRAGTAAGPPCTAAPRCSWGHSDTVSPPCPLQGPPSPGPRWHRAAPGLGVTRPHRAAPEEWGPQCPSAPQGGVTGLWVVPRVQGDTREVVAEPCRGIWVPHGVWELPWARGHPWGVGAAPSPTHRRHLRLRRATPSPHELEQELQGPQDPQVPRGRAGAGGSGTLAGVPRAGSCVRKVMVKQWGQAEAARG